MPATTFLWSGTLPTLAIAQETAREIADFRQTLPSAYAKATDVDLGYNLSMGYMSYLKDYMNQPGHYLFREYVLWRTARWLCWMSRLPKPLAEAGTATPVLVMNLAPDVLDDATAVAEYAQWEYVQTHHIGR